MGIRKLTFATSASVALVCMLCARALIWRADYWKAAPGLQSRWNDKVWEPLTCRARLYIRKAEGGASDLSQLSWTELWGLTGPGIRFHCDEASSLEASLLYSTHASEDDIRAGARIFHDRCTGCHGNDASGGPHGPSLLRPEYNHGDSDLAIYKVLRDGVPGTAMPPAHLPLREALQVTANLKMLQAHVPGNRKATARPALQVTGERLLAAGTRPDEWLMYSGSYNGRRYAPLAEITPANVARLRTRWVRQFDSGDPGAEATPLLADGMIFTVPSVSHISALDAETGDLIWEYDRSIPADVPVCCGRVNRGLAVHGNTLFFAGLDGYLVAISANDGQVLWQTSVASPSDGYSLTGAPLVIDHSVVVGVAGGEFGVRGFLAAYDPETGQRQWKFDTIPAPGEAGHDTWENEAWRTGGGPTWNTGSYDPSTGLLYWGVGNPGPNFSGDVRPGDNLFTDSVIALHAATGKLAWYFQFTPHDEHDWDSTQVPVLADLPVNGVVRKVICWANRNGFYYVLDRVTGEFLSGTPFVEVDWATGLNSTGRPILSDAAKVSTAGRRTRPGVEGATNWQSPTFDERRGTLFVPTVESSSIFTKLPADEVIFRPKGVFVGSGWTQVEPATHQVRALDAATGRAKWRYDISSNANDFSSLLATQGGLVFGAAGGICFALDADTGREVWRLPLGGVTRSSPISFALDGQQVIAVMAGRSLFMFGL